MNWKYRLEVKNEWQATKAGDMTIQAFAAFAAGRIKALPVFGQDRDIEEIVESLEDIAADATAETAWFDDVWAQLYDWADGWFDSRHKMCWVRTF